MSSPPERPQDRRPSRLFGRRDSEEKPSQPGWHVEPSPDGRGAPPPPPRPRFSWSRHGMLAAAIIALFALNAWIVTTIPDKHSRATLDYSGPGGPATFRGELAQDNIKSVSYEGDQIEGEFRRAIRFPADSDHAAQYFLTRVPPAPNGDPELYNDLRDNQVQVASKPPQSGRGFVANVLLSFGPTLLFLGLLFFVFRRSPMGGGSGLGGFGCSRAKRYTESETRVTFDDVAGIDEAKLELSEIVDFLKSPDKYRRLGGRIPRGVLLSGPPGTGKTLLARAVAGEAGVPFFSMSASELIEMIVRVGASRVRDLCSQAKAAAPAIIFIDELDAIGRSRWKGAGGFGGGHDEREQTLNQILTEMDGFAPTSGVIVLAATNRPDVLDSALLRPGRFDRRVAVQPPDKNGRLLILKVHTRSVPLADDVELGTLASTTPGMVGADLANLVNEAALLAARREHERVERADFTEALEKILLGAERKILMGPDDRRRTAYHEAGHAIVGMVTPGADPVRKVSIIPRGMALGVTFSAPNADRFNYDRDYLLGKIKSALGGRVAEEIVFGDLTTGAESDIQQVTSIARRMVGRWGMSTAIGPIAVIPAEAQNELLPGAAETSAKTQEEADEEVRRIILESYEEVHRLLVEHRDKLESLTQALLQNETLDEADAYEAAGLPRPPADEDADPTRGEIVAPAQASTTPSAE